MFGRLRSGSSVGCDNCNRCHHLIHGILSLTGNILIYVATTPIDSFIIATRPIRQNSFVFSIHSVQPGRVLCSTRTHKTATFTIAANWIINWRSAMATRHQQDDAIYLMFTMRFVGFCSDRWMIKVKLRLERFCRRRRAVVWQWVERWETATSNGLHTLTHTAKWMKRAVAKINFARHPEPKTILPPPPMSSIIRATDHR